MGATATVQSPGIIKKAKLILFSEIPKKRPAGSGGSAESMLKKMVFSSPTK